MIPDAATAALGILLAITILATVGRMDRPGEPRVQARVYGQDSDRRGVSIRCAIVRQYR